MGGGSPDAVGLQYVVSCPKLPVNFVKTGVLSETLLHTSATVGTAGMAGAAGSFGIPGAAGIPGIAGGAGSAGGFGGAGGCITYFIPSTGCPSMSAFPRFCTCTAGICGIPGIEGAAGIPGICIPGSAGAFGIGTICAVSLRWSRTVACCIIGLVMTDMFGMSMRIWPLVARSTCEADCWMGAPGCGPCEAVWHCEHEGGAGGGGAWGGCGAAGGEKRLTASGYHAQRQICGRRRRGNSSAIGSAPELAKNESPPALPGRQ